MTTTQLTATVRRRRTSRDHVKFATQENSNTMHTIATLADWFNLFNTSAIFKERLHARSSSARGAFRKVRIFTIDDYSALVNRLPSFRHSETVKS